MAAVELDPEYPPCLHFISAFLSMEPIDVLITLAKKCDGGLITESLQRFIWDHCITKNAEKGHKPYVKKFIKRLINDVESEGGVVLDEFYEEYVFYMTTVKDENSMKEKSRVLKLITFLFPENCHELPSCPESKKVVIPLQSSLNMLEGYTGCSIWHSSFFMSEFILSYPEIFRYKSCFEVGSGVGLVGICLSHVKASKVILTDGDLSSLANMKANLELNQPSFATKTFKRTSQDQNLVQCIHLPWESAPESELRNMKPDIVLGADVMYDPSSHTHLIRVLSLLLNRTNYEKHIADKEHETGQTNILYGNQGRSIAYIATVMRNIDTFNHFLLSADEAKLTITDATDDFKLIDLLPYMQSYDRPSIRLLVVSCTSVESI